MLAWVGAHTLSTPYTLSDPSPSPCKPVDHPVPAADSPALITCPCSPIQPHGPPIACYKRSPASGGLRSGRLAADWPPDPCRQKKKTPTPSQKKSLPDQNSHPVMGDCAARAVGEPISSCDPKNGSIVTDHPDSEVAFDYGVL